MKKVFADTGYWIALVNPRDQLHARAVGVTRELASVQVVTTEMVLVELLNSLSDAGLLRVAAGEVVQGLRRSPYVKIVPQTSEQFGTALLRYQQAADKGWSLTDCASFQVMVAEDVQAALTHDQHFVQCGFKALLR
jgi:predicted nucleic acid-binding protein